MHARLRCQNFVCHYCGCWRLLLVLRPSSCVPFLPPSHHAHPLFFCLSICWSVPFCCPSLSLPCLLLRVIKNFYRSEKSHQPKKPPNHRTTEPPSHQPLQLLVFIFIVNVNYSSVGDNCQSQDLFLARLHSQFQL